MKVALLGPLVAAVIAGGAWASAHHSFAATYDENQTVEIQGRLVQFQFRNPHSFVHVDAPDEHGQMWRWAVEWGGAAQLGSQGVTGETLRPGDEVTIVGNPGRRPEDHRIRMRALRRVSDGFGWGQRPDEVFD